LATNNSHIIQKIRIDLNLSFPKDRHSIAAQVKRAVKAALKKQGKKLDGLNISSVCQVDKLEIDMEIQRDELDALDEKIGAVLSDKLDQIIHQTVLESVDYDNVNPDELDLARVKSSDERKEELFEFFAKTGVFPWWSNAGDSLSDLEEWLAQLPADKWFYLITAIYNTEPRSIQRLARQFSEKLLRNLIKKSTTQSTISEFTLRYLDKSPEFIKKFEMPFGQVHEIKVQLYRVVLQNILLGKSIQEIFGHMTNHMIAAVAEIVGDRDKIIQNWRTWICGSTHIQTDIWLNTLDNLEPDTIDKPQSSGRITDIKNEDSGNIPEYEIPQAGLVLLHPFIQKLFRNLGFLTTGEFTNERTHEHGVCLLHYLSTGRENFDEHEMILPKFLCGWPLSRPLQRFLPVSEYEKEECSTLLENVIDHWSVLKNTSPEGLQVNFLIREGSLKRNEFGWGLFVEHKAQDVLLDKLPWEISIVKSNWMDEIITVHWTEMG